MIHNYDWPHYLQINQFCVGTSETVWNIDYHSSQYSEQLWVRIGSQLNWLKSSTSQPPLILEQYNSLTSHNGDLFISIPLLSRLGEIYFTFNHTFNPTLPKNLKLFLYALKRYREGRSNNTITSPSVLFIISALEK